MLDTSPYFEYISTCILCHCDLYCNSVKNRKSVADS